MGLSIYDTILLGKYKYSIGFAEWIAQEHYYLSHINTNDEGELVRYWSSESAKKNITTKDLLIEYENTLI